MPKTGHFESKLADFNSQMGVVVPYINTNATRLAVSATNLTALNTLYTHASTTIALLGWKELWLLYSNKDTKTTTITDLLKLKRKQLHPTDAVGLENLLRSIYADIPASALTATDRITLTLPLRKAPTKAVRPTTVAVLSLIEQGHLFAFIKLGAKAEGVKTREIWSAVVPHGTAVTPTTVFTSFTDCGRTIYDFHFSDDQVGQDLLIKTRDKNTAGTGDFSPVLTIVIS